MRALAGLLLAAALAAPAPARADETWMVVVPIAAGDARAPRPADLARTVADVAALRRDLRVISAEDALADAARAGDLESCGADRACYARVLAPTRANLALLVLVSTLSEPPLIAVRLFDVRAERFLASVAAPLTHAEGTVRDAIAARAAAQLDAAGFPQLARLEVVTSPPDATVRVLDGAPDPERPGVFIVPAGSRAVRVERADHRAAERTVVARAGATVRLTIVLEPDEGGVLTSPWFWATALGVAAAAGVVATVAATSGRCICIAGEACDCP